jgi:hypothetical protein
VRVEGPRSPLQAAKVPQLEPLQIRRALPGQIEICPGRCLRYRYVARKSIALVFLDDPVAGVTPAPIAEEGYLDTLDLKNDAFTVVGCGTDEFIIGSAASPKAITDAAPSGPPA